MMMHDTAARTCGHGVAVQFVCVFYLPGARPLRRSRSHRYTDTHMEIVLTNATGERSRACGEQLKGKGVELPEESRGS